MKVELLEYRPLIFMGFPTFYKAGTIFEVEEICKNSKSGMIDGWLKLSYAGCTFDGWQNPKDFKFVDG